MGYGWGNGVPRRYFDEKHWANPLKWNARAARDGVRRRVFCGSMCDIFDNEVDDFWRRKVGALIDVTPHLDWLLTTKRIGNAERMLADMLPGPMRPNVWLIATMVNQEEIDRDMEKLVRLPAVVHGVSIEPMLGPVDLLRCKRLPSWVIAGFESEQPGHQPRCGYPAWLRSLRDQCAVADIAFHFKQFGAWGPAPEGMAMREVVAWAKGKPICVLTSSQVMVRLGAKNTGNLLDGRQHLEFPTPAAGIAP